MSGRLAVLKRHLLAERTLDTVTAAAEFRYTVEAGPLTEDQRRFYDENGYFVVRGLVSQEKLKTYERRFIDICSKQVVVPFLTIMTDVGVVKEERSTAPVTKIQNFQEDDVLFDYCALSEILRYVSCFTGPDIMAMHTMLISKPPDPGTKSSRHPMHQDLHYFPFRPSDRIVCAWTAMEHIHRANGCLVVVPGTHVNPLLPHEYPKWEGGVNKMYHGIQDYNPDADRVHLEMQPGDTVFFHPLLIHGSGMNRTKGLRNAISCHFASSHCYYLDVLGTSQQSVMEEVQERLLKRLGDNHDIKVDFTTPWRLKGRLVQGVRGTL
jgi:phytanoyl-CoA hydroxylase